MRQVAEFVRWWRGRDGWSSETIAGVPTGWSPKGLYLHIDGRTVVCSAPQELDGRLESSLGPLSRDVRHDAVRTKGGSMAGHRASRDGIARHGRLRTRSPLGYLTRLVGAVVAIALVGTNSVAAIATWQVLGNAKPSVSLAMPGTSRSAAPELTAQAGEVNMLLVATDTRDGQGAGFDDAANKAASSGIGNNDTTILVHIFQDHSNMAIVSFPRDLMISIPACANDAGSTTPATSRAMLNTALS